MTKYDEWVDYEDEMMGDSFEHNLKRKHKLKKQQKENEYVKSSKKKPEYRKKDNRKI